MLTFFIVDRKGSNLVTSSRMAERRHQWPGRARTAWGCDLPAKVSFRSGPFFGNGSCLTREKRTGGPRTADAGASAQGARFDEA